MNGTLRCLSVGEGDVKLTFDPKNKVERDRTSALVGKMLREGYAIMVQVGEKDGKPLYQRATKFDAKTCEYLVMGDPSTATAPPKSETTTATKRQPGRPRGPGRRIPATTTHAISVGRTAGGWDPDIRDRITKEAGAQHSIGRLRSE